MELHAVLFTGKSIACHPRLAKVLAASAVNTPHKLTIHYVDDDDEELWQICHRRRQWFDNARKAKHHWQIIEAAEEGSLLGMLDTDTMILGDLSEIESCEFELAYTVRPPGPVKCPINTGVYFVRITPTLKAFYARWLEVVVRMLRDVDFHDFWKSKKSYGGIHQAALGYMLETSGEPSCSMLKLPCEKWNCVSGTWEKAENPLIVHIMSPLREWCLGRSWASKPGTKRWVQLWKQFEASLDG